MPRRDVPKAKTRRALAKLRRAVEAAEASGEGNALSAWEQQFAASVEERLETYGSAFTDPAKGRSDEALSARQAAKLREIAKKAKTAASDGGEGTDPGSADGARKPARKPRKGFKRRAPPPAKSRVRDVDADALAADPAASSNPPEEARSRFRVIDGGAGSKSS